MFSGPEFYGNSEYHIEIFLRFHSFGPWGEQSLSHHPVYPILFQAKVFYKSLFYPIGNFVKVSIFDAKNNICPSLGWRCTANASQSFFTGTVQCYSQHTQNNQTIYVPAVDGWTVLVAL